jgi:hypothetical protein
MGENHSKITQLESDTFEGILRLHISNRKYFMDDKLVWKLNGKYEDKCKELKSEKVKNEKANKQIDSLESTILRLRETRECEQQKLSEQDETNVAEKGTRIKATNRRNVLFKHLNTEQFEKEKNVAHKQKYSLNSVKNMNKTISSLDENNLRKIELLTKENMESNRTINQLRSYLFLFSKYHLFQRCAFLIYRL